MPERTLIDQLSEWRVFAILVGSISTATSVIVYYRNHILKNCAATKENSVDIKSIKEDVIPTLSLKEDCLKHESDIINVLTKEIKNLKIDDLEDKIMFIEFRQKEGTATNADDVMLNQHIRRLDSLRK